MAAVAYIVLWLTDAYARASWRPGVAPAVLRMRGRSRLRREICAGLSPVDHLTSCLGEQDLAAVALYAAISVGLGRRPKLQRLRGVNADRRLAPELP